MTNEELKEKLFHVQAPETLTGICRTLCPTPVAWNAENKELTTSFEVGEEFANPVGWLHGGIIATLFDHGLGMIASCFAENAFTPTVTMNLEYLRPTPMKKTLFVHAQITKVGRNMIHVRGELLDSPTSPRPTAVASAIYAVHSIRLQTTVGPGTADKEDV